MSENAHYSDPCGFFHTAQDYNRNHSTLPDERQDEIALAEWYDDREARWRDLGREEAELEREFQEREREATARDLRTDGYVREATEFEREQ